MHAQNKYRTTSWRDIAQCSSRSRSATRYLIWSNLARSHQGCLASRIFVDSRNLAGPSRPRVGVVMHNHRMVSISPIRPDAPPPAQTAVSGRAPVASDQSHHFAVVGREYQ